MPSHALLPPQLLENWEIARQEVMLEHSAMMMQYRQNKSGLQAQLEAGVTFKKSLAKSEADMEFVPVNLHIQEMKVYSEREGRGERVGVSHYYSETAIDHMPMDGATVISLICVVATKIN